MSSADRLLAILDLFTIDEPDWAVEEVAEALEIPTSTIYRYFGSLARSGMLATVGGGRYVLGPSIIRFDRQLRLTDPLVRSSRNEMDRVAAMVEGRGVVFLCRLFGSQVMCVAQVAHGAVPFTISYERGRLMPLFAGSASRVILANLPPARISKLFRENPEKFKQCGLGESLPQVRRSLKTVRSEGSFVTVGEIDQGMRGISVPLIFSGKILGSLSIAGPQRGFTRPQIAQAVEALREATGRTVNELHHWVARTTT